MIMLNTVEARVLLDQFNAKVPGPDDLRILDALHNKLKNHEWLIEQCEAVRQHGQPTTKEPA